MFLQKFNLVIRAVQIFRLCHQNCLIFEKISARDNRHSSNFQVASTNLSYFCENFRSGQEKDRYSSHIKKSALLFPKFYPAIIGAVRIFKWLHKICLIFCQSLARDDWGSLNFQNTSIKRIIFEKISAGDNGQFKFTNHFKKRFIFAKISALHNRGSSNFQITSTKRILRKFQLVIKGASRIFK